MSKAYKCDIFYMSVPYNQRAIMPKIEARLASDGSIRLNATSIPESRFEEFITELQGNEQLHVSFRQHKNSGETFVTIRVERGQLSDEDYEKLRRYYLEMVTSKAIALKRKPLRGRDKKVSYVNQPALR